MSSSLLEANEEALSDFYLNPDHEETGSSSPKLIVSESVADTVNFSRIPTQQQDSQEVELDDGSTAILFHNSKDEAEPCTLELIQQVQLENGSTAFLCQSKSENMVSRGAEVSSSLVQLPINVAVEMRRTFVCDHDGCSKVYTTAHHLRVHKRSHTGERPYVCEWKNCNKVFSTSYALKSHNRVHTGEKPYPCTAASCTKAFKTSGDLQKHVRTHTGEKPFKCPFKGCGKAFTTSNICKVHIRTHTGERPYKCSYPKCMKTFSNITNYKNHMRIHTGEKPYLCDVKGCGKQFTEYSSLYKHQVVHCVEKPYVCVDCGKTYRQLSTLTHHRKKVHCSSTAQEHIKKADFTPVGIRKDALLPTDAKSSTANKTTSVIVETVDSLPSCLVSTDTYKNLCEPDLSTPRSTAVSPLQDDIYINRAMSGVPSFPTSDPLTVHSSSAAPNDEVAVNAMDWLAQSASDGVSPQVDNSAEVSQPQQQQQQIDVSFPFATFELNGAKYLVQMISDGQKTDDSVSKPPMLGSSSEEDALTLRICSEDDLPADAPCSSADKADVDKYIIDETPKSDCDLETAMEDTFASNFATTATGHLSTSGFASENAICSGTRLSKLCTPVAVRSKAKSN